MKLLFSTLIMLMITVFSVNAQQPAGTTYFAQPDLKRFTGEWECIYNDTTFSINFKLIKTHIKNSSGNVYIDLIQGDYMIKKNGQILRKSSDNNGINSGGYVDKNISKDRISFLFTDVGRKSKRGDAIFELSKNNANQANWTLTNTEGVRVGYYDYTFSVPEKAVFKRVH